MERISAISDLGFKKVLASEENKDVLAGLIKDFFGVKVNAEEIVIEKPYSIAVCKEYIEKGEIATLRQTLKDVSASFRAADFVSELQVSKVQFFDERALYYPFERFCQNYSRIDEMRTSSDGKAMRYSSLRPVYALNIMGYRHFEDDIALRIFELYDPKRRKRYKKNLLRIGFFELSKSKIETANQKHWRDYFTTGEAGADAPAYIKKAGQIINCINLSEEERNMLSALEKYEADQIAEREYIYLEGRSEGEKIGEKRGEKIGEKRGEKIGEKREKNKSAKEKVESIKSLIKIGLTDKQISEVMKTDIAKIVKLRNQ